MMMLLLVSAAALLVNLAAASPPHRKLEDNLNSIIDLAEKYNETLVKEFFVEDVSHLVEAGCQDNFFCKVYDVLHKHEHFGKRKEGKEEKELVRNLKIFLDGSNSNCTELLKEVTSKGESRPIPALVENLTACIRQRNLTRAKKIPTAAP
ncbi:uncharacterized protein LOC144464711 [Epinephelus lanceolatus]